MKERNIERLSISDQELLNWMATLREGGFTDEEIDGILSHLNTTYAGLKKSEAVNREFIKWKLKLKTVVALALLLMKQNKLKKNRESVFVEIYST